MQISSSKLITAIANAHPESVRLLYNDYGIEAPVSPRSLYDAIVAFGKPFQADLAKLVATENPKFIKTLAFATGSETTEADSSNFWTKFMTAFSAISTMAVSGASAYDQARDALSDDLDQDKLNSALYINSLEQQNAYESAQRKQQMYLFGGLGLAFIVIIYMILNRR